MSITTVWYFAYGSNMQSATLRGRRGIRFRRAVPARAAGWRLVFDKPPLVPIGESFANIVPDPAARVFGVAFEVTEPDLEHIELTEGVALGNYRRVAISAAPLSPFPAVQLDAFTLTSEQRDPGLQPSTRYMQLLVNGAQEHGLPAEHVDYLRAVPANPPTAEALHFGQLIDQALRRS
ncbi:MAG: gamma-glutamylcyclotransferase family protein [Candidatus Binatia bacterium]